ncbi:MAG: HU family DNA-binding protein [Oleiphilaceae bacterium]|nr:HU family DNA-binding protein [Oleiphilaceae bacterium]
MLKPDLIKMLAEKTDLSQAQAGEVVNAFTDQISAALARGEAVTLTGFGTFSTRNRDARTGRNPQTGASLQIPASRAAAFKAGKNLKESIN